MAMVSPHIGGSPNVRLSRVGKRVNKYRRQRDIAIAEWLGDDRFRVPLSCDFRGRIYGVSDFHFAREDHVRSLFRFAEGLPIGDDGLRQLMIHAANCGDFEKVSKAEATMACCSPW